MVEEGGSGVGWGKEQNCQIRSSLFVKTVAITALNAKQALKETKREKKRKKEEKTPIRLFIISI